VAKEDIEYRYKRMRALFVEKMFRDGSIDEGEKGGYSYSQYEKNGTAKVTPNAPIGPPNS